MSTATTIENAARVAGHTPGPWKADPTMYSDSVVVTDARGFEVATADFMPILLGYAEKLGIDHWADRPGEAYLELSPDEQAANAYLIAAAPDLLEACQQAAAALPTTHAAFETVRAAIRKALSIA